MAAYRVLLTAKAETDIEAVLQWFESQQASAAGTYWLAELATKLDTLESHPDRCVIAVETIGWDVEVREILFGSRRNKYRIFFQIAGQEVTILRIWHSARDVPTSDDLSE
ncbi:type II toxin-antitoxin system RelE/ParE family toxin [Blastopirellula sp. JC732]|uniref:Type II toxin-antitoxin system RelE/ParE family toxin n=1 Tax=Blastopirellula sediminis TaxID=2894196 RepID=A0A9X1SLJ1_9BACT|nr:type II toxin-antitoxin system RelE/ParE family toxin [Blastopirellula sediminis]MCC9605967.1 type II toxin-antitoxin system RelE/ParE family toxin [Blastopirellula sediminis]MCC9630734.1 type II toxin-antitoxin system RelE/ParE family toxin [Blastopirellula sediminis]